MQPEPSAGKHASVSKVDDCLLCRDKVYCQSTNYRACRSVVTIHQKWVYRACLNKRIQNHR